MTRSIEEQLSALLDSELPIEEEALLLKRLESDSEYRRTLGRYALIGDLVRGTSINRGTLGLSESVSAAVATEQAHVGPESDTRRRPRLGKGLVGAAIAASVAVLALVNFGFFQDGSRRTPAPVVARTAAERPPVAAAAISYTVPPASPHSNVIAPARLTNYLVSHSEYSNSLSRQVMDSYIVNQIPDSAAAVRTDNVFDDQSFE